MDRWLARTRNTGLSRNRLQQLIEQGRVLVNGRAAKPSLKLKAGDRLEVSVPPRRRTRIAPEPQPLAIVFEDDALLHHAPEIAGVGGEGRPGVVHRLDRDTSGLLVVAKTEAAYLALVEALREREVKRVYQSIVWGDPGPDEGVIDLPIGRDPRDRKRMAVVRGPSGKPARTRWRVLERYGLATLVEARLETGRTHQIRVHMSALKHPVVGDPTYGGRVKKMLSLRQSERSLADALLRLLRRQALHAAELEFAHPDTGERLRFRSDPPQDFREALERLRAFSAHPPA